MVRPPVRAALALAAIASSKRAAGLCPPRSGRLPRGVALHHQAARGTASPRVLSCTTSPWHAWTACWGSVIVRSGWLSLRAAAAAACDAPPHRLAALSSAPGGAAAAAAARR
jgi:hypothetical protein